MCQGIKPMVYVNNKNGNIIKTCANQHSSQPLGSKEKTKVTVPLSLLLSRAISAIPPKSLIWRVPMGVPQKLDGLWWKIESINATPNLGNLHLFSFILIYSCAISSFGQHCLPKSIVHLLPDLSIVQPLTKQCPEPNKGPQLPRLFQWIGSSYSKGYHLKKTMRLLNQLCDGWKSIKQEKVWTTACCMFQPSILQHSKAPFGPQTRMSTSSFRITHQGCYSLHPSLSSHQQCTVWYVYVHVAIFVGGG